MGKMEQKRVALKSDYYRITLLNSKYKVFKRKLLFKLMLHLELTYKSFSLSVLLLDLLNKYISILSSS